jgi:hypothetical protein
MKALPIAFLLQGVPFLFLSTIIIVIFASELKKQTE